MNRTAAFFFTTTLICLLNSSVSAQQLTETPTDASAYTETSMRGSSSKASSSKESKPELVDLDFSESVPSEDVDEAPIRFAETPVAENLDEKVAKEAQGQVLFNSLKLLGYATLTICLAIGGLVFYNKRQAELERKQRNGEW